MSSPLRIHYENATYHEVSKRFAAKIQAYQNYVTQGNNPEIAHKLTNNYWYQKAVIGV